VVNYRRSRLDAQFAALADPARRGMVERLRSGEATVSDLATDRPMSLPAVLKHLHVLERAGLVASRKVGRVRFVRLIPRGLDSAVAWIGAHEAFWRLQLDRLERCLEPGVGASAAAPTNTSSTPCLRRFPEAPGVELEVGGQARDAVDRRRPRAPSCR
jgi:DNA-binding transcriptional ArsR family regulator